MNVEHAIVELAAAGFDLVHAFDAYACAAAVGVAQLDDPERPCGLLVASTRALWPHLVAARAADPELASTTDPIDRYTEACIARIFGSDTCALFPHARYAGAFLPFQRIAVAAGFAALAPTQLLVHPRLGPWFGLRAIVLHRGQPVAVPTVALPCQCEARCRQAFADAQQATGDDAWRAWLAVRDACPVGREHRYGAAQISYHYTKDPRFLVDETGSSVPE